MRECGPDTVVWTWSADQTAGFWLRKMVHDGVIHRFDAELAVGLNSPVAADLAADGVTDLLVSIATLSPPDSADPIFAKLCGRGQTLHFHATDPGLGLAGEWLVRRTPRVSPGNTGMTQPTRSSADQLASCCSYSTGASRHNWLESTQ